MPKGPFFSMKPPEALVFVLYYLQFWMIVIIFSGLLFGEPFYKLLSNDHPLKLLLLVDFALIITWSLDRVSSSGNPSSSSEWSWVILSGLVTLAVFGLLTNELFSGERIKVTPLLSSFFFLAIIGISLKGKLFK